MNRTCRLLLVVAVVVLLPAASAQAWRSAAAPAPQVPVPGGPAFLSVDPTAFHPVDDGTVWGYYEGWQLYNPGGGGFQYVAALTLPDNVTITQLVVAFYDNAGSGANLEVRLWRHNPGTGLSVEMAVAESSGAVDQYRWDVDDSIFEPVVDQQQYAYSLEAGIDNGGDLLRLTGVRIDYAYDAGSPLASNNHSSAAFRLLPAASAPAPQAPVPGGPAFLTVDPTAFHPAYGDTEWGYYEGWQLYNPGGEGVYYVTAVTLPDSATITQLVVAYYDSMGSPCDLTVKLWRHNPGTGGTVEMASVGTDGVQDLYRYGVDESIVEPVVDQQQYTYSLEAYVPGCGDLLRLTGVRIDYAYGAGPPLAPSSHSSAAFRLPPAASAPAPQVPVPGGPAFLTVDPTAFHPADDGGFWAYYEGWQLNNPGDGSPYYVTAVTLPDSATITQLVVAYYACAGPDRDLLVRLWRHNPGTGGKVEMASVESSGVVDQYRYDFDPSIAYPVVDQQEYTYSLEAYILPYGDLLRLTGVRIDYAYRTSLPLVLNNY